MSFCVSSNVGNCRLVGVARLDPIQDAFLDNFLRLPSECLAVMSAQFVFPNSL